MTNLTIITLTGTADTGKTTVLNKVIDLLSNGNTATVSTIYKKNFINKDRLLILDISGYKIGITTRGDAEALLKSDFNCMTSFNCDLYVCASRSKGQTLTLLNTYTKSGKLFKIQSQSFDYYLNGKSQNTPNTQDAINNATAELIINLIDKIKNNQNIN